MGFVKGSYSEDRRHPEDTRRNKKDEEQKERHTLTISGGFTGRGESNTSRKKYVRQVRLLDNSVNQALAREPNITFSTKDCEGIIPHDNDLMVVTLQIFN